MITCQRANSVDNVISRYIWRVVELVLLEYHTFRVFILCQHFHLVVDIKKHHNMLIISSTSRCDVKN